MSIAIDKMVAQAEATLGLGEPNYIQDWYDAKFGDLGYNWAWCDASVTYWAWKSGNQNAVTFGGGYSYTVEHAQAFWNRGQWHTDVAGIRRGDIVFFDWSGSNSISAIDHVGLVTSVDGDGTVHTIEGNIENACRRKLRYANFIAGYGRPNYAADPVTPPPPPPAPQLPAVDLSVLRAASYSSTGTVSGSEDDTTRVQNALAKVGLIDFLGRGEFGPLTTAGYAAWQRKCGYSGGDADGHPGPDSLTKLGAASGLFRYEP